MLHDCCSSILIVILGSAEVCWLAIPPCAHTLDLDLGLDRIGTMKGYASKCVACLFCLLLLIWRSVLRLVVG